MFRLAGTTVTTMLMVPPVVQAVAAEAVPPVVQAVAAEAARQVAHHLLMAAHHLLAAAVHQVVTE